VQRRRDGSWQADSIRVARARGCRPPLPSGIRLCMLFATPGHLAGFSRGRSRSLQRTHRETTCMTLSSGRSSHRRSRLVHARSTTHRTESTTARRPIRPNTSVRLTCVLRRSPILSFAAPHHLPNDTRLSFPPRNTLTPALPRPTRPARHHHTVSSPRPRISSSSMLFASLLRERTMPPRLA
jgi:hypothetical protein